MHKIVHLDPVLCLSPVTVKPCVEPRASKTQLHVHVVRLNNSPAESMTRPLNYRPSSHEKFELFMRGAYSRVYNIMPPSCFRINISLHAGTDVEVMSAVVNV